MKNRVLLPLLALLPAAALAAAPLTRPTPVHAAAFDSAAVLTVLAAGSHAPLPAPAASAPAGWLAVELPPPHEVYVANSDIAKNLTVKPGAAYRSAPDPKSPSLAAAGEGDPIEITGLRGRWTQLRLNRPVTGFIRAAAATPPPPPASHQSGSGIPATPISDAPRPRAAALTPGADTSLSALPRFFSGKVVSTRAPLRPRRPFDFALVDATNERLAYLDFSQLLQTTQIENYLARAVEVYGPTEAVPGTNDIVVRVESLRLR